MKNNLKVFLLLKESFSFFVKDYKAFFKWGALPFLIFTVSDLFITDFDVEDSSYFDALLVRFDDSILILILLFLSAIALFFASIIAYCAITIRFSRYVMYAENTEAWFKLPSNRSLWNTFKTLFLFFLIICVLLVVCALPAALAGAMHKIPLAIFLGVIFGIIFLYPLARFSFAPSLATFGLEKPIRLSFADSRNYAPKLMGLLFVLWSLSSLIIVPLSFGLKFGLASLFSVENTVFQVMGALGLHVANNFFFVLLNALTLISVIKAYQSIKGDEVIKK